MEVEVLFKLLFERWGEGSRKQGEKERRETVPQGRREGGRSQKRLCDCHFAQCWPFLTMETSLCSDLVSGGK